MSDLGMKLRAFTIDNPDFNQRSTDILSALRNKLLTSENANARKMVLNEQDENREADLISNYNHDSADQEPLFCTMLRIAPGNNVQHVSEVLMGKNLFSLDELDEDELNRAAAIYKSHYYFALTDQFLVTNLPGNRTIRQLQTYLNWLLGTLYELTPMIDTVQVGSLRDIKNITFQDSAISPWTTKETDTGSSIGEKRINIGHIAADYLRSILASQTDVKYLDEIELEQMISAKLIIQFKRQRKNSSEEIQKAYGALLKPIADLDDIAITDKNGKVLMNGKSIQKTKTVKIDRTTTGKPNEQTISQEMRTFLLELAHEKDTHP
ncbi:hypothetical protein [Eikenella sp. NML080894]|uniref:hypothetical protein n=1 Tax=Eikenella sp. NML080894 TaxID=1795830 RepID=UPI0009EE05EA|nr:hypothetical protein [Eikenella sp. NML080894]